MSESIWKIKGFLPYVLVVFLNAFTDLGHKIVIQNTVFKIYDGETQIILTAIVNALILLPFILLFSPSGFISDRYSKSRVLRIAAGVAVVITLLITLSYYLGLFELAFAMTFLLAVQSAIYSPAKYGYIKELVGERFITMGNGIVQAVTTVSILGGILAYSILFERRLEGVSYHESGEILRQIAPVGWALVAGSLAEFLLAFRLPDTHIACDKHFEIRRYLRLEYLRENMRLLRSKEIIFVSIIGLSLFWGISQVVLSSFPEYAKNTLGISNTVVVQGMMAIAGIGIVIGSIVAGKVSKNFIETGTIPLGAIGITLSLFLLPLIESPLLLGLNFLLFGLASGLFIVPLNALIQYHSPEHDLGMILAGNNFMQNVAMVSFLAMTVFFALLGLESVGLFYLMLLVAAIGTVLLIRKIPQSLVQFVILSLVSVRFRLTILGFERMPEEGGVLMLGNHISWIDWALLQMAVPRRIHFVMDRTIYEKWYFKPILDFFEVIPISERRMKQAIRDVERRLAEGRVVCIFPEGTISRNGHLGVFKRGFERMVGDAPAVIVPFYLRGLWGDPLSRASAQLKKLRRRRRNDVILAFGEPMAIHSSAEAVKQRVFELSCTAWESYTETLPTLSEAWVDRAGAMASGGGDYAIADWGGTVWSRRTLLAETLMVARRLRECEEKRIGILLPSGSDAAILLLAGVMAGKVLVPLCYRESDGTLQRGIEASGIGTIYTQRAFFETIRAKLPEGETAFEGMHIVTLDEIRETIGRGERLVTAVMSRVLPPFLLRHFCLETCGRDEAALILFDEKERGVVLSHRNLMAHTIQLSDMLDVRREDVLLSVLPPCDPLGSVAGLLMPLLHGIPTVCYPDPANPRGVGRTAARYDASILFSRPEYLRTYAEAERMHPLMLASMRFLAVGGGLAPALKARFEAKFRCETYEGYACTASSAMAGCNLPDILETETFTVQKGTKAGTLGMPLPGTAYRIVTPGTLEDLPPGSEGELLIGGAQVMSRRLESAGDSDAVLFEERGLRWYRSGERASLDEDGFLVMKR
jgi:acyl-[acyl-carrier-protein]-phospholipid O-acyltransferase/long-chain-fatty-acid--[acyl-carrier-protein] ligase